MDLNICSNVGKLFLESLTINSVWSTLHEDVDAVTKGLLAGIADNDREEKGASRIDVFGPWMLLYWEEVNHRSSNSNTNTHQQVTQHM